MSQIMNAEEARQAIQEGVLIKTDRANYECNVRDAIIDFRAYSDNVGNEEMVEACNSELERLDEEFEYKE